MSNITPLQPPLDLPMEVLGVLMRQAEPTAGEIAHDIEAQHRQRLSAEEIVDAIHRLLQLGYRVEAHNDPDAVRYELVQPKGAA